MDVTPVRPPPEGVESNMDDPESKAWQMEIIVGVMISIVVISMLLRTYCRLKISRKFGIEDCKLRLP